MNGQDEQAAPPVPVGDPYPKKRYHATKDPVYVQSEAEEKSLGSGWHDSPKAAKTVKGKE